jgi:hypothetical protein
MRKLDKKIELYKHIMYFYKDYVDRLETPKIKKLRDQFGRYKSEIKEIKPLSQRVKDEHGRFKSLTKENKPYIKQPRNDKGKFIPFKKESNYDSRQAANDLMYRLIREKEIPLECLEEERSLLRYARTLKKLPPEEKERKIQRHKDNRYKREIQKIKE